MLTQYKSDGGSHVGCTVARIHLNIAVTSATAAGQQFSFGVMKGQDADVGLNIAGAPDVSADPYGDWLIMRELFCDNRGNYWPTGGGLNFSYDIRAKRKLEKINDSLSFVLQTQGHAGLAVAATARILLMLP
jgi:hypothetical protein